MKAWCLSGQLRTLTGSVPSNVTISIPVWNDQRWWFGGSEPAEMMVGADYCWWNELIPSEHSDTSADKLFSRFSNWLQEKGEMTKIMSRGGPGQQYAWLLSQNLYSSCYDQISPLTSQLMEFYVSDLTRGNGSSNLAPIWRADPSLVLKSYF